MAFVDLAKRFHPDSGTSEANSHKFTEIESAYREIQRARYIQRERDVKLHPDVEEFDIKHTAPQHRHYLAYNVGIGTLSKRQQQHMIQRVQTALDNVMEHKLIKSQATERNTLVGMDKQRAKDIKTRYGMDRLVEDLIQESMNKGEFANLSGAGKPLKDNASAQNPYVDFVTHKMNQILINNGFTPEWIQLSKEIREEKENVQNQLTKARNRLGTIPLSSGDLESWRNSVNNLKTSVKKINDKINKYNLLVPILQKQMLQVRLEVLAEEALIKPPIQKRKISENIKSYEEDSLFKLVFSIFSNKN